MVRREISARDSRAFRQKAKRDNYKDEEIGAIGVTLLSTSMSHQSRFKADLGQIWHRRDTKSQESCHTGQQQSQHRSTIIPTPVSNNPNTSQQQTLRPVSNSPNTEIQQQSAHDLSVHIYFNGRHIVQADTTRCHASHHHVHHHGFQCPFVISQFSDVYAKAFDDMSEAVGFRV